MKASRPKKPEVLPGQLDLFAAPPSQKTELTASSAPQSPAPQTAPSTVAMAPARKRASRVGRPLKIEAPDAPLKSTEPAWSPSEEWWTSKMVCAFLKISRKTLWERRKMKNLDFPKPTQLGGSRNLYRAACVREWAERMADVEY